MIEELELVPASQFSSEEQRVGLVRALREFASSFPPEMFGRAASVEVSPRPVIYRERDWIVWRFEVRDSRNSGPREAEIGFMLEPSRAGGSRGRSPAHAVNTPHRIRYSASSHCDCHYFQRYDECKHDAAIARWMLQTVCDSHEKFEQWLASIDQTAPRAGDYLLRDLVQLAADVQPPAERTETRIQWRISLDPQSKRMPITVRAIEQRLKKSGRGWTKGRELRAHAMTAAALQAATETDRALASQIRAFAMSYTYRAQAYWELLPLFCDHPAVAWDDAEATPIVVEEHPLRLALREHGEDYRLLVTLGDMLLTPCEGSLLICGDSPETQRIVVGDHAGNRLLFSARTESRLGMWILQVLNRGANGLEISRETAVELMESSGRLASLVEVELPESLAGPAEPLPPELSLLLTPSRHGLQVALRLADARLAEPLVPGLPPQEVRIHRAEGPLRLVRNPREERERGEALAERLQLGALDFVGEYSWQCETDDAALRLLDTLRELGDEAPPVLWPEGKKIRMLGELQPQAMRVQVEDRRDWFGLTGSLKIDDVEISLADLLAAVRGGQKYVRVGDNEFARVSDTFRKRLEQLGDTVQPDRGGVRVASAAVPAVQELIGGDIPFEAAARWRETLSRLEQVQRMRPRVPKTLDAELRSYQKEGYCWLAKLSAWGAGGLLADDMGLGKTVQTLGVLLDRASDGPALIVAPTSVGDNWFRETLRFAPSLTPHLYRDGDREAIVEAAGPRDLVIVSYQLLRQDAERFGSRAWHTLVLDEAQYIKNAATKTAQAVRAIEAGWRLGLSGTPLENHLGELWSLLRTISPGLLGSWEQFRTRFADPIEKHGDEGRRQSLARLVQPFILRRTKDKVLSELPPRTEVTLFAEMGKTERRRYEAARLAALADLNGGGGLSAAAESNGGGGGEPNEGDKRFRVLAWLTRMRQMACHPRLVDATWKKSSAKLDLFLETVEELREGEHRALVFSQFVQHLSIVREALDSRGIAYQYLDGATPSAERQRRVDAFQQGEGELFLISLKAGGTGLNLTAADYVIHLDPWWNPAVEDQATDRAHRIGQSRPVTVFRLVARDSIEEQILSLHADKRELVASVLDGTDRAGRMSTAEMIELIRGGAD
ncbi:DEAD/DEAH box helicase [Candidatus Laterigemmans baculatus]|uniref:DEAD/DEAH box helicase n=1 Tax=Candidatus Laterigemmans baculatus TaxID=2770505 RepID=UPI0013D8FE6A|nr:DEAD/DEAH box helicase [Candidatus Laterigemmans baculatus]